MSMIGASKIFELKPTSSKRIKQGTKTSFRKNFLIMAKQSFKTSDFIQRKQSVWQHRNLRYEHHVKPMTFAPEIGQVHYCHGG